MEKQEKINEAQPAIELLPKAIIFNALGGFTAQLGNSNTTDMAANVEHGLAVYLSTRNMVIDVGWVNGKTALVFAQKP